MQKEITNLLELPNDYEYITNDIIKKFYTKNINKIIEDNTNVFSVFHYNSISLLTQKDGVSYWMVREISSDKTAVINSNKAYGTISKGVADLWFDKNFSEIFKNMAIQLALTKGDE